MTREKKECNRLNQRGAVAIIVAVLIAVFLGFAALAIDLGYVKAVRNQLQNAADAAALDLASKLYPQTPPSSPSPPNWPTAAQANTAIGLNKSDNRTLSIATVNSGYWNMAHNPSGLQGTGITPGSLDCPAVQVTVSKSGTINSGPVRHWFAPVIGIRTSDVSATATAAVCSPGEAKPGTGTMPFAIGKNLADSHLCGPSNLYTIYSDNSCVHQGVSIINCGQWTTFFTDPNNNSIIADYIQYTTPSPDIKINDTINIVPGVRASDYHWTETYRVAAGKGQAVFPVVPTLDLNSHQNVVGFLCFTITDSNWTGSLKYIVGYFDCECYAGGTSGCCGPNYGAYTPPVLVQ